jgi:ANTAR domain
VTLHLASGPPDRDGGVTSADPMDSLRVFLNELAQSQGEPDPEPDAMVERVFALLRGLIRHNAQLECALHSRIEIEQAKGILAERFGLDVGTAFDVLRRAARSHRMDIHALARGVVDSRETPVEIERVRTARNGRFRLAKPPRAS